MKCPNCGKQTVWNDNPHRPFCSERCQLVDLGKWATEEYRIPVVTPPEELEKLDQLPEQNDETIH